VVSWTPLEMEKTMSTVMRDELWFENLEGIESTLTEPIFRESGVVGSWFVTQDDLYAS
jgi:hypothetical protein